jgi:hypothetical protein
VKNIQLTAFIGLSFMLIPMLLLAQKLPADRWQYIMADSSRGKWGDFAEPNWLRYYGLGFKDINGDKYLDIVAGRYVYHNPGGDMNRLWKRTDLGINADGLLFLDVDKDAYPDFIAEALPNVYWFEATNKEGTSWRQQVVANLPKTSHVNSQGFIIADLQKGGKAEAILAAEGGVYCLEIPKKPGPGQWKSFLVAPGASDEGIGVGDVDGDGDLDLVCGREMESGKGPNQLFWYENPGNITSTWNNHFIGKTDHDIDRVEVADYNGDQRADVAITEERWPGLEPDASLFLFTNPGNAKTSSWGRKKITTGYSINNLDAADLDRDGDIDLVSNEHKGQTFKVMFFENDGKANFNERILDQGKECHLGTQLVDLDGDGDLDLASVAWDFYKFLHIWRNDAIRK